MMANSADPATNAPARDNAALASKGIRRLRNPARWISPPTSFATSTTGSTAMPTAGFPNSPNPPIPIRWSAFVFRDSPVRSVAFGRDNGDASDCCRGTLADRALGTYSIQITRASSPDASTPETGDASTGWVTVGELEYRGAFPNRFTPHLRHRYSISQDGSPVPATGIRLKVSSNQLAIDELEVNPAPTVDENASSSSHPNPASRSMGMATNGDFFTTNSPANAPLNDALPRRGRTRVRFDGTRSRNPLHRQHPGWPLRQCPQLDPSTSSTVMKIHGWASLWEECRRRIHRMGARQRRRLRLLRRPTDRPRRRHVHDPIHPGHRPHPRYTRHGRSHLRMGHRRNTFSIAVAVPNPSGSISATSSRSSRTALPSRLPASASRFQATKSPSTNSK